MQYYGSKEGLFAAAAALGRARTESLLTAVRGPLPAAALDDLLGRMEDAEGGEAAVALLRSCLTHPVAARVMRDEVMCDRKAAVEAALEGDDAALRAGVFAAVMMGLAMARYLLERRAGGERVAGGAPPRGRAAAAPRSSARRLPPTA